MWPSSLELGGLVQGSCGEAQGPKGNRAWSKGLLAFPLKSLALELKGLAQVSGEIDPLVGCQHIYKSVIFLRMWRNASASAESKGVFSSWNFFSPSNKVTHGIVHLRRW